MLSAAFNVRHTAVNMNDTVKANLKAAHKENIWKGYSAFFYQRHDCQSAGQCSGTQSRPENFKEINGRGTCRPTGDCGNFSPVREARKLRGGGPWDGAERLHGCKVHQNVGDTPDCQAHLFGGRAGKVERNWLVWQRKFVAFAEKKWVHGVLIVCPCKLNITENGYMSAEIALTNTKGSNYLSKMGGQLY